MVLDMGTDNLRLLNDKMYLGNRHARVRGQRYDDFIDTYVTTATKLFPHALLHWEDLGAANGGSCSATPTSAAPSTTTCRAPPPSCWRRRSPRPGRAGPAWPTSGW